jgi:hypothetical protein
MQIGNWILNVHRQFDFKPILGKSTLRHANAHVNIPSSFSKPTVNSSLNEIKKFVYDKYVKRKYVDPNE